MGGEGAAVDAVEEAAVVNGRRQERLLAVEGSREKALAALASDSMMLNFKEVEEVFDAIVEGQGPRLARFRKRRQ